MTRIQTLLEWCKSNGVEINPRLSVCEVRHEGEAPSITVYATDYIPAQTTVVKIPKLSILSVASSSISNELRNLMASSPVNGNSVQEPNVWLSVAVLVELKLKERSRWCGYLQSLPTSIVPLATFWHTDGGSDGIAALAWVRGTEVNRLLRRDDVEPNLRTFFQDVTLPLLQSQGMTATYDDMRYAYSLVSSRAFQVDAYHGIGMVPIADAFNHVEENHVHFESDYQVCPSCGSFDECEHDADDPRQPTPHRPDSEEDDTSEIVSNAPIYPNDEVFNTYDSRLPNAQLLCHYGFLLEGNSNDVVTWSRQEVVDALDFEPTADHDSNWPSIGLIPDLVYGAEETSDSQQRLRTFAINAEGLISLDLFTLLVRRTLEQMPSDINQDAFCSHLCARLSRLATINEDENSHEDDRVGEADLNAVIMELCGDVDQLCSKRTGAIGPPDQSGADWGAILDTIPATRPRTRLAITHAMGEKSILDTCRASWQAVAERIIEEAELGATGPAW